MSIYQKSMPDASHFGSGWDGKNFYFHQLQDVGLRNAYAAGMPIYDNVVMLRTQNDFTSVIDDPNGFIIGVQNDNVAATSSYRIDQYYYTTTPMPSNVWFAGTDPRTSGAASTYCMSSSRVFSARTAPNGDTYYFAGLGTTKAGEEPLADIASDKLLQSGTLFNPRNADSDYYWAIGDIALSYLVGDIISIDGEPYIDPTRITGKLLTVDNMKQALIDYDTNLMGVIDAKIDAALGAILNASY